ncbi:MAG TPA: flavodoxin family protein [bacterium]|mgnify:CR=1 FL=1|nr:flavodoxin family protein [bacterium]HPS29734.1 flavodoxin family protein [bacterium]
MKVVAFNGSPRKGGNTGMMIRKVFEVLEREGIECELIQVGGNLIRGCSACGKCKELQNGKCIFNDDPINGWIEKMVKADGIIIGSPTYFAALTSETKAFIDRVGYVSRANGGLYKRKAGAAVVAARRAGALNVFQAINNFLLVSEMAVPGSTYWNLSLSRDIGEFEKDEEGVKTMLTLGENMAWLLKKINQ